MKCIKNIKRGILIESSPHIQRWLNRIDELIKERNRMKDDFLCHRIVNVQPEKVFAALSLSRSISRLFSIENEEISEQRIRNNKQKSER